mgnify:FL=1
MIQIIKSDSEANKTLPPINDSDLLPAPPKKVGQNKTNNL